MLLEFSCSNHRSIRDEILFSAIAGSDKTHAENIEKVADVEVLKSSVIYGANGSGKSNFIDAIAFVKNLVSNIVSFLISFFVPLPMAIYEFNKLIFGKNIKSYITLLIVSSLYYLAPNISYIALKNFALIDRFQVTNPLYIKTELYFYISFAVVQSAILFIVLNITLIVNKKNNVKNTVTLNGLGFIINFGFLALCYIGLAKS